MKPKALAIPETEEPPSNHCPGPDEPEEPPSSTAFAEAISRSFAGSPNSLSFRQKFFPTASDHDWHSWQWQLRHRLTSLKQLEKMFRLSEQERHSLQFNGGNGLPLAITPYYASLLDPDHPEHPLRRTMVPTTHELLVSQGEEPDPLGEDGHSPVPGLIHRYPDRVLFLVTDYCSSYCRYCTRSRMVGKRRGYSKARWQKAIAYIAAHPEVRDVLISGGDPLTLPDHQLEWLLGQLHAIEHVEMIRIGTKTPMVLPQRITPELVNILKRFHPLWLSIHCTHPDELTPEAQQAFARLADGGIPLGSQTVLLAGINDSVATMKKLMHGLVKNRVKPYYLYQCDPIIGSSHFRTPVSKGLEIYQGLRGHTTGYAVPNYVIDAPGGGGKIPLLPETVVGREGNDLMIKNYEGKVYRYPDVI